MRKYKYDGVVYGDEWWLNKKTECEADIRTLLDKLESEGNIKVKMVYCDKDGDEFANSDDCVDLEDVLDRFARLEENSVMALAK